MERSIDETKESKNEHIQLRTCDEDEKVIGASLAGRSIQFVSN